METQNIIKDLEERTAKAKAIALIEDGITVITKDITEKITALQQERDNKVTEILATGGYKSIEQLQLAQKALTPQAEVEKVPKKAGKGKGKAPKAKEDEVPYDEAVFRKLFADGKTTQDVADHFKKSTAWVSKKKSGLGLTKK